MNYNEVISAIEVPNFQTRKITENQNTKDIIADLIYCFKLYNGQAKPLVKKFSTGNIKTDSKKIYDFIKDNIHYEAEPFGNQTTASFSRILHEKQGDCKHSALIASCLGWQLGYDVLFRFVDYNGEGYGHVYVILIDPKTNERIIVDPLQPFNYEKKRVKTKNYKATHMALNRITGTGTMMPDLSASIQGVDYIGKTIITMTPLMNNERADMVEKLEGIGKGKVKAAVKKAATKVKAAEKKVAANVKTAVKNTTVKKIALAPVRGAFSALLLLNGRGYASRLKAGMEKDSNSIKALATKFGYDWPTFQKQVDQGAKKKELLAGMDNDAIIQTESGIGIVAATVATSIAVAAPIILAVTPLLKQIKLPHKSDKEAEQQAVQDIQNPPAESAPSSKFMDTIKKIPTPVLWAGAAGILFFGGKKANIW